MKKLLVLGFSILLLIFGFQKALDTQTKVAAFAGNTRNETVAESGSATPIANSELAAASEKAIKLIQKSQAGWYKKETCTSCHHQLVPQIPIALARERGVPVDEAVVRETTTNAFAVLKDLDWTVQGYDYIDVNFDGWSLTAANIAGIKPNPGFSAEAQFIASRQLPDGSWPTIDVRPPQSFSSFTATAVCAQAINIYLPEQMKDEKQRRMRLALNWLTKAQPKTTEDRTFQLFGLRWTGADRKTLADAGRRLIAEQRADGGWSQDASLLSDAYSTGEALTALVDCALVSTTDPVYQRGLRFLLDTQQPDGSWRVVTRLHPPAPVSPPFFETGFPYKHDQFVSTLGTSWAAAAMLNALPKKQADTKASDDQTSDQPAWVQVALNGTASDLKKALDAGMKPDSKTSEGTTALMIAARDIAKVRLLIERGADVNARASSGLTALMVAARHRGNIDVVRELLKKRAKVTPEKGTEVRNNASAFFFAAMAGDVPMAQLLLDAGAKVGDRMKILGRFEQAPMFYSVFLDTPMVEFLLKNGASANEQDDDGISPLSWAVIGANARMVPLLLSKGADVNHVDKFGMTPLLYAASVGFGDPSILEKLIGAGADLNARNKEGLTALDLAKNYNHQATVTLLTSKATAVNRTR